MTKGEIILSTANQERLRVLLDLEADRISCAEAAEALKVTVRHVRNLRLRLRRDGAAGLIHGNQGRRPANASDPAVIALMLELWHRTYTGFNQVFFTEMLEREEGVLLSRSTVRRSLAADGIGAAKPQKRSRHRRRRVRRSQEGAMIQMDGSDHDWLGNRGPRLTLVGGIDDATGHAWAVFRTGEDTAGYFHVLAQIIAEYGIPGSVYTDQTAISLGTLRTPERVRTDTVNFATQMTRVLNLLGISLIRAHSPQAKGRVERLWGTLQDRLVCELRAKGVRTLAGAQRVLRNHLHYHNRNFAIPAADPVTAWLPLPDGLTVEDAVVWTYPRTVTNANTVSVEGAALQLEFPPDHAGWARRRVLVSRRLDGTWFATFLGVSVPATPITRQPQALAA